MRSVFYLVWEMAALPTWSHLPFQGLQVELYITHNLYTWICVTLVLGMAANTPDLHHILT